MAAAMTAFLSVVAILINIWLAAAPRRQKEKEHEEIDRDRRDIVEAAAGDAAALARAEHTLDDVLRSNEAKTPTGSPSDAGSPDHPPEAGRTGPL